MPRPIPRNILDSADGFSTTGRTPRVVAGFFRAAAEVAPAFGDGRRAAGRVPDVFRAPALTPAFFVVRPFAVAVVLDVAVVFAGAAVFAVLRDADDLVEPDLAFAGSDPDRDALV